MSPLRNKFAFAGLGHKEEQRVHILTMVNFDQTFKALDFILATTG